MVSLTQISQQLADWSDVRKLMRRDVNDKRNVHVSMANEILTMLLQEEGTNPRICHIRLVL